MVSADRKSYDTGAANVTEDNIESLVNRLETLINERDRQAQQALADFKMTAADDEYRKVESRWKNASSETREIIRLVRTTIGHNTQTATQTVSKTRSAIANIG